MEQPGQRGHAGRRVVFVAAGRAPGSDHEIRRAPPEPTGYTIERPARIAVDLRDTTSGLNTRSIPLGSGNAQSMTVVETKDRTRLIFNLVELAPYETVRNNNSLVMTIGGESSAGSAAVNSSGTAT